MKLKTSYFNESIVKKNITRFAPLWGIYLVMGVLITLYLDIYDYRARAAQFANVICMSMTPMAVVNFGYAALCALLLFGDLHKTRMCYSLHAMPMRREGWFLTHVLSGLSFSLLPNLIVTLIMLFKCGPYFYVPLAWLLVVSLQFLCFFGIAVFCMHITGKGVAAVGMYLLINFFATLLYGLTELYFGQFWRGVIILEEPFAQFIPIVQLMGMSIESYYDHFTGTLYVDQVDFGIGFLWAGIGTALLVLALLVYRKRDLESAGDFITLRPAAPVVLVIYTVAVGGVLWAIFNFNYFVLLVGLAIGFFTGRMLLQRTVKVFGKKNFLGYGIVTGCVLLSIGLAILDPVGITRWVPEADRVESVSIGSSSYSVANSNVVFTAPEDIERVREIHKYGIENSLGKGNSLLDYDYSTLETVTFCIRYNMTGGIARDRIYEIPVGSEAGQLIRQLHSRPEYLFSGHVSDAEDLINITSQIMIHHWDDKEPYFLSAEEREGLIRALEQDWQANALVQTWQFREQEETLCYLEFYLDIDNYHRYVTLDIYKNCTYTITWLKDHGYLE